MLSHLYRMQHCVIRNGPDKLKFDGSSRIEINWKKKVMYPEIEEYLVESTRVHAMKKANQSRIKHRVIMQSRNGLDKLDHLKPNKKKRK